jgi:hypothetical protein
MKHFFNEHWDFIQKILGIALLMFVVNRISKIFKGKDGEFQVKEFCQMAAFLIFTTLACYMIWKEANRAHEWHLFDAVYVLIVFGSLLSILHMDHAITNVTKVFEIVLKLRMKTPQLTEAKEEQSKTPNL